MAELRERTGCHRRAGSTLSAPWIDERDEELVLEVLRSGHLSLGPTGPRFEQLLAERGRARRTAPRSRRGRRGCTSACASRASGPGDEVITSPYSFVASANCAIYEGATPVFADIDPRTFNLDPAAVEAAVTPRTKAIVAVDIFGYPCELDELRAICDRHGLALVEDACEALGARYKGRPLGSHGHPAVWAFYPEQADDDRRGRRGHDRLGGGARAAGLAAQPGAAGDLELAPARPARLQLPAGRPLGGARDRPAREARPDPRGARARWPRGTASCSPGSMSSCRSPTTPITSARGSSTSSSCRRGVDRDGVDRARSAREGIACAPYLPSIHLQSYMRERFGFSEGLCPVSEDCSARTMAIPFHARLEREDQERVAEALRGRARPAGLTRVPPSGAIIGHGGRHSPG